MLVDSLKGVAARHDANSGQELGQLTDHDVLASAVDTLEGIASSLHDSEKVGLGLHRSRFVKFPETQAVRGFVAAWLCRNKERNVPSLFRQLLLASWPGAFGEALVQAVDNMTVRLPSRSSLQRWIAAFDAAIMLRQREVLRQALQTGLAIFWGADSSPQHGQDWLLSAYAWVARTDLPKVVDAVRELQTLPQSEKDLRKQAAAVLQCIHMHRLGTGL